MPHIYVFSAFSANGAHLVGENVYDSGFFFGYLVVRVDTGEAVFGGEPNSADEKAGWGVRLGTDERAVLNSANTSTLGAAAKTNSLQQCTIGDGCTDVQPALKTAGGQPRNVVESPSSD